MKTKENIESLFNNLKTWIEFPKYQAERRLDVFFGLYLEDILKRCRNELFRKEDHLVLIPEFPLQKNDTNNECTNIDYLVFNTTKQSVHAIELKTDNHSIDDEQIKYYHKFKDNIELKELFDFVKRPRTGRSGKKYKALYKYIKDSALEDCSTKGNVIYLLPLELQTIKDEGFDSIPFSEIVEKMKPYTSEDELLDSFLDCLSHIGLQNRKRRTIDDVVLKQTHSNTLQT